MSYQSNPILDKLPKHLRQYIKPQNYQDYTPINQAVWRYVMRKNVDYLQQVAHESYLEGLSKTGISIEQIPSMYGMNRILRDIGWAAVAVDGFIPPAAFMEFQAYNVLVIASEIRQLENIKYTPAPDIIHEGAGHAPIIAHPEYAEYLRRFGEIGCKAISSAKDMEMYNAIRHLSIIKEQEGSSKDEIRLAEEKVESLQQEMGEPSEMAQLRNLHWWTVEYGLIGTLDNPKIYGAGLLSSIGESKWCMKSTVKKMPYTIEAAHIGFDITKPQPQLFVTPNFAHLSQVLEDFANSMALRKGGLEGVQKLIESNSLGTVELSTGLQISGVFSKVIAHNGKPVYIQTTGQTALSFRDKELIGHGIERHADGFGTPLGKLKGMTLPIENMAPRDLKAYNIFEGEKIQLEFEGDISLSGEVVTGTRNLQGQILLITFKNTVVRHADTLLFSSNSDTYSIAVGVEVVSAFQGIADLKSFDLLTHEISKTPPKTDKGEKRTDLEHYYQMVRDYREGKNTALSRGRLFDEFIKRHPEDWLLPVELYELAIKGGREELAQKIEQHLEHVKHQRPDLGELIDDGISLAKSVINQVL